MARTALLIGAEINGLTGVGNDVAAMAGALGRRGFDIRRCEGPDASRAGILAAYETLIADARSNDAICVYYSGHGGLLRPPDPDTQMPLQFILPFDYQDSTDEDFRGVTSVELSVLQARLTGITHNVTVVVDCCHAAHLSRNPDLMVKGLTRAVPGPFHATYATLQHHVRQRVDEGLQTGLRDPFSNPWAVRIVACAPDESAYEYTNHEDVRIGMLTEALTDALDEAGDLPVTWSAVLDRARRRVLNRASNQHPNIEGPSRRLLFELRETDTVTALPVVNFVAGSATLQGAALLGVQAGDEFTIMPPGAGCAAADTALATAEAERVGPVDAEARVTPAGTTIALPVGAVAYRTRAVAPARPVRLPEHEGWAAALAQAMAGSTLVRPAGPDDEATIEVGLDPAAPGDSAVIHDAVGPLSAPRPLDDRAPQRLVEDLERLARADAVRTLTSPPDATLDASVTVDWGRVVDGETQPLGSGAVVYTGERLYFRVRNDGRHSVFVSLVDVGVAADVTLLTDADQSGVEVEPGQAYVYGRHEQDGNLVGLPVSWPAGLRPDRARPETVVVLVTSAPQAVGVLRQTGVRGKSASPVVARALSDGSPLEQWLAQIASGGDRDLTPTGGRTDVRYAVHAINFDLTPAPPPPVETARFLIDERPDASAWRVTARGATPTTVAVRLEEVVVHRNRALASADIRVDAVVLTGSGAPDAPVYRTLTERFSNVSDGDTLPLSRMLIYHGPAVDFLDLGVWVSRDAAGSLALADLLSHELTGEEFQAAGAQLAGLMLTAPHAAAAAAAIGAGAIVMSLAYRVLVNTVGTSIGLYRTSLLANEQFGIGRHPAKDLLTAQDFSLAYTVEAV